MTFDDYGLLERSDYVDNLPLMSTPAVIVAIFLVYWLIVFLGPKYMKNKKPYDLSKVLIVYNLICITLSLLVPVKLLDPINFKNFFGHIFTPIDPSNAAYLKTVADTGYLYAMTKLIELLDTVFFVLRKKNNQITFLHVYHHTHMGLISWFCVKYFRGNIGAVVVMVNSIVHVVMYSYYLLSALGPGVQKYLWWKKYITKMQLIQFVFIFSMTIVMTRQGSSSRIHELFTYFSMFYAIVFFSLFMNFYVKSYQSNVRKKKIDPSATN